jgi:chromosomal replication initiation ATPase DnaA
MTAPRLDPGQTFTTLVSGAANQLVLAAARAVAESSRPPFNPLVVHGRAGVGKTHLLHAIGHRKLEVDPRATVRLVGWPDLVAGWRAAVSAGRAVEYLRGFREAHLLLLDDADGLSEASAGGDELVGMIKERVTQGMTTVLATRRSPGELLLPEDPMGRLLAAGLVVELGAPDSAMRWDILHTRSEAAAVPLSSAVLEEIAALPFDSIRELIGAASRLLAFQAVSQAPLDPAQARVLITGVLDEPVPDTGVTALPTAPPRAPGEPRAAAVESLDEFGSFLSDVVASVSEQVDEWRSRIADALVRWEAEGFRTARLQALLDQEMPAQPDMILQRFERDVAELKALETQAREASPDLELPDLFRDPDRVAEAADFLERTRTRDLVESQPAAQFRLEDLVEGTANRLVIDAVRTLIASPGDAQSPMLVVGDSGVGKTHLLHALGNALVEQQDLRGVVCESAHSFQTRLLAAEQAGELVAWRRRYRWVGALLLDDIHLLGSQAVVQEELAGLLDQLAAARAPVVVTSAVPLTDLPGLSPQLLSRLGAGLMLDLPRPDREIRLGVVRRLLAATEAGEDAGLADYLANRPADSLRAVHSMIQRVLRAALGAKAPPSQALARQALEGSGRDAARRPGPVRPGVLGPTLGSTRLREKLVEVWPTIADRLVEEFR